MNAPRISPEPLMVMPLRMNFLAQIRYSLAWIWAVLAGATSSQLDPSSRTYNTINEGAVSATSIIMSPSMVWTRLGLVSPHATLAEPPTLHALSEMAMLLLRGLGRVAASRRPDALLLRCAANHGHLALLPHCWEQEIGCGSEWQMGCEGCGKGIVARISIA